MELTGFFNYKGLTIMQHKSIGDKFDKLIKEIKPERIIEIGTSYGGLTLLLRDLLDTNDLSKSRLITYDINTPEGLKNYINKGVKIELHVENIFNHNYNKLENGKNVIDLIKSNGTTLVLCDGGSKINEFNILSEFLKVGDVIMAHDYAPNKDYFDKHIHNKIWNWFEIQDSDINESCEQYNLIPYMEEELRNVVWVCKIKQ